MVEANQAGLDASALSVLELIFVHPLQRPRFPQQAWLGIHPNARWALERGAERGWLSIYGDEEKPLGESDCEVRLTRLGWRQIVSYRARYGAKR